MKKKIIAASAASAVLAAMPVVGVFADTTNTLKDTVQVTLEKSCSFEMTNTSGDTVPASGDPSAYSRTFSKTVALGQVVTFGGASGTNETTTNSPNTITVVCSSADVENDLATPGTTTWSISALASNNATMVATGSGAAIATNASHVAEDSGATSYWSFRITPQTNLNSDYDTADTWYALPSVSTPVASATPATATDMTFAPEYRVYIGTNQAADTYTGLVTYTLTDPWTHNS